MQKFVVNKGKRGYDFTTMADTREACIDLAFENRSDDIDPDCIRSVSQSVGPFTWWKTMTSKWGNDKWYVVELSINPAVKAESQDKDA